MKNKGLFSSAPVLSFENQAGGLVVLYSRTSDTNPSPEPARSLGRCWDVGAWLHSHSALDLRVSASSLQGAVAGLPSTLEEGS